MTYCVWDDEDEKMPYCVWDDDNWDTLIHTIRQNNCILMLGQDAAAEELVEKPRPLTEILANELVEKVENIDPEVQKKIDPSDLVQVSQYYCMNKGRHSLEARVSAFYNEKKNLCSKLHQNLAHLPFYLTITTTPDNMLKVAMEKEGKKPTIKRYHFNGNNPRQVEMGTIEKPLIFYLYGMVDEPNSLVITENDLLDFLVSIISEKRPMPKNVLNELRDESKSFLFLGFGFRNWYLRILLHVLQGRNKVSHSFAMEQFIPEYPTQIRQTVFFFQRSDYKIYIFRQQLESFAAQLREKFSKSSSTKGQRPLQKDLPGIFICYASEDKEFADFLYKKLETAGLKPWLDKENLRGGDNWDQVIEETLENVDYVLVLQSKALAKKHEGYVIGEINSALDRQKKFRRGYRFIIPIKIDESPLLKELKDLQTVDLREKGNIDKLIDTIIRDFKKRGNL